MKHLKLFEDYNKPAKKVEVTGEYSPKKGDWDALHSFQSRRSDGFGGKMNTKVNEALVKYWTDEKRNPTISKIEITIDEAAFKVKWKCIIEESKDGKAWMGLTSRGGAGHPDGPSGSKSRAKNQIEKKKKELASEFSEPTLESKEVLDFNYTAKGGKMHVRQIFIIYTRPKKYPARTGEDKIIA
jgi:hypothetical protein